MQRIVKIGGRGRGTVTAMRTRARARPASPTVAPAMASDPRAPYRVLVYSHDACGLGQLRRCRAIAHALVARHEGKAAAVACLGGYSTFCEVLSFGKPCLVVPPDASRGGPLVRAEAAQKLGLVQMLNPDQLGPETLPDALAALPVHPLPAADRIPELLGGLAHIHDRRRTVAVRGAWPREGRVA